jgi:methionyl-tRNA formyltransferase
MTAEPLRLIFMGTPEFSVITLNALIAAGHEIVAVYTQPPRPAGRGQSVQESAVHKVAGKARLPVRHPKSLNDESQHHVFAALEADAAIVVAYGLILPPEILAGTKFGCINIHASLLPRWHGAAPFQRAIMAGDRESGVSIMAMDEGLDTGPVYVTENVAIEADTTAGSLHDQLAEVGAALLVESLDGIVAGKINAVAQTEEGVTYAKKISRGETRIDWTESAAILDCLIRGLSPRPGTWAELDGERIRILATDIATDMDDETGKPGEMLDDKLLIGCGEGALRLTRLQRAGKKPMDADELLRGFPIAAGKTFA